MKAKRIYRDTILIDVYEHRTLMAFETHFNISVWFACFPPDEPNTCHLFLNRSLAPLASRGAAPRTAIAVPLQLTKAVDERRDFMAAVLGAIRLR